MLTPDRKLYLGNLLKCYEFLDANAAIGSEVAHVLVQSPEVCVKRKRKPKGKPLAKPAYAMDSERIDFAGRGDTVAQLQHTHIITDIGASQGVGKHVWQIELVDHFSGLGKSDLAFHFIQQCREQWPDELNRYEFRKLLCSSHYARVWIPPKYFVASRSLAHDMNVKLARAIQRQFVPVTAPASLTQQFSCDSTQFAEDLVQDLEALFIALEGIVSGFIGDGTDEYASWRLFEKLCNEVPVPWMLVPGFFFLLVGCASFFKYAPTPMADPPPSRFMFNRLNLPLIRPGEIEEILIKTRVVSEHEQMLRERWRLQTGNQLKQAAQLLFEKTSGQPRVLWKVLDTNDQYSDFVDDKHQVGHTNESWAKLTREIWTWRSLLTKSPPSFLSPANEDLETAVLSETDEFVDASVTAIMEKVPCLLGRNVNKCDTPRPPNSYECDR